MSLDPNDPGRVAHAIADMMDQLESTTAIYRDDIERAARSNAAYKKTWAESLLAVIAAYTGRMTVAEREAHVEIETNDARVVAEVHDAQAKATREALNSLRVRLDSARSLGANLRGQS